MNLTPWPRVVAAALTGSAILALVVLAFLWPSVTSTVHDIPIAVVGDNPAVTSQLSRQFDVLPATSREDAIAQLHSRTAYGAIVLGTQPEVLSSSANGTVVGQMLDSVAARLNTLATDVVPFASSDARGTGLSAMTFPLVIGGIAGGVIISMLVRGVWRRLLATAAYGVGAGVVIVAIAAEWFGILQGDTLALVAAVTMAVLAVSAPIVGLTSVIGPAGIGVVAVVMMFLGNQISGAAAPWQFLPSPWGVVGQFFPPGAGATLMRNLSYFPDATTAQAWWVLASWIAAGVVFMVIGHRKMTASAHSTVPASSMPASSMPAAARVGL